MIIKSKKTGQIVVAGTGIRKGKKIVKFMGVTITVDSNFFRKHWEIIEAN